MRRFFGRGSVVLAAVLLGAAIAFPLGVIASHQFSDVPDSNTFHNDIDAIADVGVTTGCGGGKYCPKSYVTREQMAAFMNRLGALQAGKTPVVNATKVDGLDSTQFVRSDVPIIGHYTCSAAMMQPRESGHTYQGGGARFTTDSFGGAFDCGVLLPDGATVTGIRGAVYDGSALGQVQCNLRRWSLFVGGPNVEMAQTPLTSLDGAPGAVVIEDTTIDSATIDNELYAYSGQCYTTTPYTTIIYGFQVIYTVTGLPVP
jgi:hypothetical protein